MDVAVVRSDLIDEQETLDRIISGMPVSSDWDNDTASPVGSADQIAHQRILIMLSRWRLPVRMSFRSLFRNFRNRIPVVRMLRMQFISYRAMRPVNCWRHGGMGDVILLRSLVISADNRCLVWALHGLQKIATCS